MHTLAEPNLNSQVLESEPARFGRLYDERTFYPAFIRDLSAARSEAVVYSPFVTRYRARLLEPVLARLARRGVRVAVFTRPAREYAGSSLRGPDPDVLARYEALGIAVHYLPGFIHEKAAVIDRRILWEGSLNILSQRASRELMRRIDDSRAAEEVLHRLGAGHRRADRTKAPRIRLRPAAKVLIFMMLAWWLFLGATAIILLKGGSVEYYAQQAISQITTQWTTQAN